MISNEEAHLNALKAELGYVKSQPTTEVSVRRIAEIEAELEKEGGVPEPEPVVETTEAPEREKAVPDKPVRKKAE